jgi:molecular chaperone GrpE (heat shock protein)
MSDPRNVAHDKKVKQEKAHQENGAGAGAGPKKKKRAPKSEEGAAGEETKPQASGPATPAVEQAPGDYEKSQTVLSKLKEMEFHSRANIETLAGLTLTIEEELKQKEFAGPIGDIYAAQDQFHTKIAELIEGYEKNTESLRPAG